MNNYRNITGYGVALYLGRKKDNHFSSSKSLFLYGITRYFAKINKQHKDNFSLHNLALQCVKYVRSTFVRSVQYNIRMLENISSEFPVAFFTVY